MAHVNKKTLFLISLAVLAVSLSFIVAEQVNAIAVGNTVQFTANTNIRSCASTGCGIITTATSGSTASVIGGPQYANGYEWWNVRLSSGTTGWAVSNWMTVVSAPAPAPTLNMSVSPTSISLGQSVTVSWSSTNATSCTGSRGGSYPTSGSFNHTPPSLPYTYGMTCTGSGGSVTRSVTVSQVAASPPTLSVSVNPTSITAGQSTTFSWSSSNATNCTGSRGGSYPTSGSFVDYPSSTTTYGMTCTGPGGSITRSATVTVSAAASPPTLSVSVSPTSINLGESVTFSWSSSNATSCTGSRGGSYPTSGSFSHTPPSLPYTYGMTCTGPGGSVTQSATVSQRATSPPVVSITSNPATITRGQSATLGLGTSNATSCNGSASPSDSNWSGSITPVGGGNRTVTPNQTTTYTLSCSGPGGSASNSATVTVNVPAGPTPLNVPGDNGPITKLANQSLTLNWGVSNVTNWTITSVTGNFSRSDGAVGATPQYCGNTTSPSTCVTFEPPAPPSGTYEVTHVYTIAGFGSEVRDSLEVVVRNQQCRDGRDNDGDGLRDYPSDPGCSAFNDDDETDPGAPPQCRDSRDNDFDGRTDYPSDPGGSTSDDNH